MDRFNFLKAYNWDYSFLDFLKDPAQIIWDLLYESKVVALIIYLAHTVIWSEKGSSFFRVKLSSDSSFRAGRSLNRTESSSFSEMLFLSVSPSSGSCTSNVGAGSHTVKVDTLWAVSSTSWAVGVTVRTDSCWRHWEVASWEKDSCKAVDVVLDGSSALRCSGEASDSTEGFVQVSKSSECVETLRSPLWECPTEEFGVSCSGRWKVIEALTVSLWVTSARSGWNESEPGNTEHTVKN